MTSPCKSIKSRNQRGHQEAIESLHARAGGPYRIIQNHFISWTQNFGERKKSSLKLHSWSMTERDLEPKFVFTYYNTVIQSPPS